MEKYSELTPRVPQERLLYAILTELVELNKNISHIIKPSDLPVDIQNEPEKPKRKKRGE